MHIYFLSFSQAERVLIRYRPSIWRTSEFFLISFRWSMDLLWHIRKSKHFEIWQLNSDGQNWLASFVWLETENLSSRSNEGKWIGHFWGAVPKFRTKLCFFSPWNSADAEYSLNLMSKAFCHPFLGSQSDFYSASQPSHSLRAKFLFSVSCQSF